MKTKKKTVGIENSLDAVISGGKAADEKKFKKPRGRPKNKVKKIQSPFYLPKNIVQAIDENCLGNKSVFAEKVFKFYFKLNNIEY